MTDLEQLREEVIRVREALSEVTDKREREHLQRALRYLERELFLRELWLELGVCCPCCDRRGIIHAHRATCVICGKGFQYDLFKDCEHMPSQPGRVGAYWNNRPKTFLEILKGDTHGNGEESTGRRKSKRVSSVIQQGDFNFTGGSSESD